MSLPSLSTRKQCLTALVLILSSSSTSCFTAPQRNSFFLNKPSIRLSNSLKASATAAVEVSPGVTKHVERPGDGPLLDIGDVATVKYSCSVPGEAPFAKSSEQKVIIGEGIFIDGWELGLSSMRVGEIASISISDPKLGYGEEGVPPFIPANSKIEVDLEILDFTPGVDLGTVASANPLKPRTPASIAAAYATRRELSAIQEANKKEGLEGMIAKFKSFYFFGFFEGETGQRAPWYLRPSITFPIAFAIVGAAFYVLVASGGISERGAQVQDELDEMLTSSTYIMKDMFS